MQTKIEVLQIWESFLIRVIAGTKTNWAEVISYPVDTEEEPKDKTFIVIHENGTIYEVVGNYLDPDADSLYLEGAFRVLRYPDENDSDLAWHSRGGFYADKYKWIIEL